MPISCTTLQGFITNLHNANVDVSNDTVTDTSFMHEQERILVSAFNCIKAHVEFVAKNTTDGETVIASAGCKQLLLEALMVLAS